MKKLKNIMLSVIGSCLLLAMVIGVSYAFFTFVAEGSTVNTITAGAITFSYTEQSNGITLINAYPISDAEGKVMAATNSTNGITRGYFDFTISGIVVGNTILNYEIYVKTDSTSNFDLSFIKVYLTNGTAEVPLTGFTGIVPTYNSLATSLMDANGKKLYNGIISNVTLTQTFRLRAWISSDYTIGDVSKTFKMKVYVKAII
ncbi:MAG: hypothetical protein RR359_04300 [Bacilli bacterium]